jgi:hypothetical protein
MCFSAGCWSLNGGGNGAIFAQHEGNKPKSSKKVQQSHVETFYHCEKMASAAHANKCKRWLSQIYSFIRSGL